jgi:hypothetical protein
MGDAFGYGHEFPMDSADEFKAIAFVCRQLMAKMDTMKPVKVVKVTGGGEGQPAGIVDVQPLVSQIDGNGYGTPHGTVPGIPWSRVQAGTSAIIMDPQVGDFGYVVAADRDMSKVKNTKAAALPGSRRRFNIADGVYVGNLFGPAPTCYLLFTPDGYVKVVDVAGNVVQTSSSGITLTPASGQPVTINGNAAVTGSLIVDGNLELEGNIQSQSGGLYAGDIKTSGDVFAGFGGGDQVGLQTHKHGGVQTGSGQTTAPVAGT